MLRNYNKCIQYRGKFISNNIPQCFELRFICVGQLMLTTEAGYSQVRVSARSDLRQWALIPSGVMKRMLWESF